MNLYRIRGFKVISALMDNKFWPLEVHIPVGVQLVVVVSTDEFVGLIEYYIHMMEEQLQSVVSVLPFKFNLQALLHGIIGGKNLWLKSFLQKRGISKTYSQPTIVFFERTLIILSTIG